MKVLGTLNPPKMETSRGKQHVEKASNSKSDTESLARKSRAVWLKLNCLKPNPSMCNRPQPESRLKPGPICICIGYACMMTSHVGGAVNETVKGRTGNLTSSSKVLNRRKSGSPKSREAHGDGVAVVVRGRESRLHNTCGSVQVRRRATGDFRQQIERRYAKCKTPTQYLQSCKNVERQVNQ
jgi:hypothetical protein